MKFEKHYTRNIAAPLKEVKLHSVYDEKGGEFYVPSYLSEVATEVLLEKLFFKGKIPSETEIVREEGVTEFLSKSKAASANYEYENSYIQAISRICGFITYNIYKSGLFDSDVDAENFLHELQYIFINNIAILDLEGLSDLGIDWAYGLAPRFKISNNISEFDESEDNAFRKLVSKAQDIEVSGGAQEAVTFSVENSDIEDFINWKQAEEIDHAALNNGKNIIQNAMHLVIDACDRDSIFGFDPSRNNNLREVVDSLRGLGIGDEFINLALRYAEQGYEEVDLNANEDKRIVSDNIKTYISLNDNFIEAALTDSSYKQENGRHITAKDMLDNIASAIWASGEPNLLFRDKVNSTNPTCKNLVPSNNEDFIFIKGKAAPSATINLMALLSDDEFVDSKALAHVTKILTIALDNLSLDNEYRAISIGFTNLAEFLLANAVAYNGDKGRALTAVISSFITNNAFKTSVELADKLGSCSAYIECEKKFLQNIKSTKELLSDASFYNRDLNFKDIKGEALYVEALQLQSEIYDLCKSNALRNLYVTSVGVDFEQQLLLGGNSLSIKPLQGLVISNDREFFANNVNGNVIKALNKLNYSEEEIENICLHLIEGEEIVSASCLKSEHVDIFDCLKGVRKIDAMGQIKMQSAIDKFLSGSVANVIEINHYSSIEDIKDLIINSWELGIKKINIYRDRCSLLAPALIDTDQADNIILSDDEDITISELKSEDA